MIKPISIPCKAEEGAELPVYKTAGAAGADVCAFLSDSVEIAPGRRAIIPTGLSFEIPAGFEIQVRPRSGLAAGKGITVLNSPGTIDSDYRGELKIILVNFGDESVIVKNRDRIAQLIVAPVTRGDFLSVSMLDSTDRGTGGFGSTGVGVEA